MAGICWRAGLPQGAHAARAAAARSAHPALETPPFTLAAASQLLDDGDDEAARAMLTTLASMRYARAPREVAVALTLLARIACEARDVEALSGHVARMERLQTPAVDRLRAWSDLGLLHLAHGDRARAQQCLTEAERLQARASKDAREQRALIRLWLDLPLREALGR